MPLSLDAGRGTIGPAVNWPKRMGKAEIVLTKQRAPYPGSGDILTRLDQLLKSNRRLLRRSFKLLDQGGMLFQVRSEIGRLDKGYVKNRVATICTAWGTFHLIRMLLAYGGNSLIHKLKEIF